MTPLPDPDPAGTKARLLETALGLFGRQGVQGTSTREIIRAAGLRNPSAITYYFGSKAKLVDELTREVNGSRTALLQQHVELASRPEGITPETWAAIGVDFVLDLLSTERGCHLIRVWGDEDERDPDRVEKFLASTHPLARSWRDAVANTFGTLPPLVAVARNIIMIRTLQWITIRRARRLVDESQHRWHSGLADMRPLLLEVSLNTLTGPTTLTDADLVER